MMLGVPTLCCYDLLDRLIASADRGTVKPSKYLIVDNGGGYETKRDDVYVMRPGRNVGVAASWNMLLDYGETIVISNDDIELAEDTFEQFAMALERTMIAVSPSGWDIFAQRPALAAIVGRYDERFWPGYYEDNDYHYRLKLAGLEPVRVTSAYTHDRSSTLARAEDAEVIRLGAMKSHEYYIRKWGGAPGEERYTLPFDGGRA